MKLVLLTSASLRHKYIAHKLSEFFELELIITEKKSPKITDTSSYNSEDSTFVKNHFINRDKSEHFYFKDYKDFPASAHLLNVNHKEINSKFVFDVINLVEPDIVFLFGTSIIKNHLIERYQDKIINLHLGLSPYFKGSATNIFPILHKKFHCIGSTIHKVTEKVDAGEILHQVRADITIEDTVHSIGNKVILESGIVLPKILLLYLTNTIQGVAQKKSKESTICKIKDLTPSVLRKIYDNISRENIEEYLKQKELLKKETPIIENFKA